MLTQFTGKKISAIYSVLPTHEVDFMDEAGNYAFTEAQMKKLKKVMGFGTRRVAQEGETVGDYAIQGIKQMLDDGVFKESEIGAIIVTTTSPDHFIPPISNIVQGKFDFDEDVVCLDISQGCCGYTVGLTYSFLTLEAMRNKKVLLIAGDMLTFRVSTRDRASRPITGDAVTISVIENCEKENIAYCSLKNDGKDAFAVYIPAGGTRMPITPETTKEEEDEFGNWRGKQHLVMQGDLVFNIIINMTPVVIEELLSKSGNKMDDIDYFVCHQSSSFTLKKLAQRLEVSEERLPRDIVPKYGNSSSATIPVTMCEHSDEFFADGKKKRIMFAAFGTGMSLGAVLLDMEKPVCKFLNYPHQS
ncbi:MAG: ketoacyl-ACP synthase III [Bacteroidales bacterium]|nr:ketoacyl-ACP synthase III [Bacteroidales bacterium]